MGKGATGTTRGSLLATGTTTSPDSGWAWHDIPIAAGLDSTGEYDFEIVVPAVQAWIKYDDTGLTPYSSYGMLTVRDGEQGGNAADSGLPHLRMFACDERSTPVRKLELESPRFYLAPPEPNPVVTRSVIRYSLEEPGPVTITLFDVQGRRVSSLLDHSVQPAGPGFVFFDAARVAGGVYFLRLETERQTVARKIIILH